MTDELQIKDLPAALAALATHIIAAQTAAGVTSGVTLEQVSDLVIARLTASAPELLDTWLELVAQIEDNEDALAVLVSSVASKADASATTAALALKQDIAGLSFGQCYLSKSGTNLLLSRHRGKLLTIEGQHEEIPSAGVTLAPSGLSSATVYYIYAYMNAGTMMLEPSVTAATFSSTYGFWVKTGDETRTLVGWARTNGSTAWSDDFTSAHVISYFNPKRKRLLSVQTANRAFSNTSMTKIHTEFDLFFLVHPDHPVEMFFVGGAYASAGGIRASIACGIGSTTYDGGTLLQPSDTGTYSYPCHAVAVDLSVATAYTASVFGSVSSGSATLQFNSVAPGFRCSLTAIVWG